MNSKKFENSHRFLDTDNITPSSFHTKHLNSYSIRDSFLSLSSSSTTSSSFTLPFLTRFRAFLHLTRRSSLAGLCRRRRWWWWWWRSRHGWRLKWRQLCLWRLRLTSPASGSWPLILVLLRRRVFLAYWPESGIIAYCPSWLWWDPGRIWWS